MHDYCFWHPVLLRCFFLLTLSAAGQARGPSVYYDNCLDPGRAPWRCSEHSTSLIWLFFQEVAFRLAELSRRMETPLCSFSTTSSALTFFHPLRSPTGCLTSAHLLLPLLLSATMQLSTPCDSSNSSRIYLEHHKYMLYLAL